MVGKFIIVYDEREGGKINTDFKSPLPDIEWEPLSGNKRERNGLTQAAWQKIRGGEEELNDKRQIFYIQLQRILDSEVGQRKTNSGSDSECGDTVEMMKRAWNSPHERE